MSEYRTIHRLICDYFREQLPAGTSYHLAPFSIRKSANIYGLIFGSSSYMGLEKFQKACWKLDGITGEANYPVDEDVSTWEAAGDGLFSGLKIVKKFDVFREDLVALLKTKTQSSKLGGASNHDIYEFTLTNGFLPKHAHAELKTLQELNHINVQDLQYSKEARKNAYYIGWNEYKERRNPPRILIRMVD